MDKKMLLTFRDDSFINNDFYPIVNYLTESFNRTEANKT